MGWLFVLSSGLWFEWRELAAAAAAAVSRLLHLWTNICNNFPDSFNIILINLLPMLPIDGSALWLLLPSMFWGFFISRDFTLSLMVLEFTSSISWLAFFPLWLILRSILPMDLCFQLKALMSLNPSFAAFPSLSSGNIVFLFDASFYWSLHLFIIFYQRTVGLDCLVIYLFRFHASTKPKFQEVQLLNLLGCCYYLLDYYTLSECPSLTLFEKWFFFFIIIQGTNMFLNGGYILLFDWNAS